jgi:hypothetical protein
VGAWAQEMSEQVSLWDSIVIFFISACILFYKRKDFLFDLLAFLIDEYEEFVDAFALITLDDPSLDQSSSGLPSDDKQIESGTASLPAGKVYDMDRPVISAFGSMFLDLHTPPAS